MHFKSISLGATIATAVIGATLVSSPAQAAPLKGTLTFNAENEIGSVTSSLIDFSDGIIQVNGTSTGSFAGYIGSEAIFKDLPTLLPAGGLPDFIKLSGAPGSISFSLTELLDSKFTPLGTSVDGIFSAKLKGVFTPNGTQAVSDVSGLVVFKGLGTNQTTISITAVPTPALLPGLLAMGVGVLRKRKVEAAEGKVNA